MLPSRFIPPGQSSAMRKSRLESKVSMIPKPRNAGSMDRLSSDMRRPSNARSSSAEPPRGTMAAGRLSREASATKMPLHSKSRSQQGEQGYMRTTASSMMTPLRTNKYSRATATPTTPSEDRKNRSWQASLDRALAFVTIKDQRPLSNPAWQRTLYHQVQEALASRSMDGSFSRPLTITRFVEIVRALLTPVIKNAKLNNDNYLAKIPHIAKLLLYPGTVSKSWLQSVNTLHAFPHALGLIAYLLDLANRIEQPVLDEWLYLENDDFAALRREHLLNCWMRFQGPVQDYQDEKLYDDLNQQYCQSLSQLFGDNDEKIEQLTQVIKRYELCLEDEAELAARADEQRRGERHDALLQALRGERAARLVTNTALNGGRSVRSDHEAAVTQLDAEIEKGNAESTQLRKEIEEQQMSIEERTRLLDEVDYANRVQDSKRALADQISKMVLTKESELALWQKTTLDSCVEYKQSLIHLSAQFPDFAALLVDEKELMGPNCALAVSAAVDALKQRVSSMSEQLNTIERSKNALKRHQVQKVEETRSTLIELQSLLKRESESLLTDQSRESSAAATWSREETEISGRLEEIGRTEQETAAVMEELKMWERQEQLWCSRLSSLRAHVKSTKAELQKALEEEKQRRAALVCEAVKSWHDRVDELTASVGSVVAGSGNKVAGSSGSKVAGSSGSKVAGSSGSKVAGSSGSEVAGSSGSKVTGSSGSNVAGSSGSKQVAGSSGSK